MTFYNVATGHSTAYDSFSYSLALEDGTLLGGTTSGTNMIADTNLWFNASASGTTPSFTGGEWSETGVTVTNSRFILSNAIFTVNSPTNTDAIIELNGVCFDDINAAEDITLTGANGAIRIYTSESTPSTNAFWVADNGEWVEAEGLTPSISETYNIVFRLDRAVGNYYVTVNDTPLYKTVAEESVYGFTLASPDANLTAVEFGGIGGELASMTGTQIEGYMATDADGVRYLTLEAATNSASLVTVLHEGTVNGVPYAKKGDIFDTSDWIIVPSSAIPAGKTASEKRGSGDNALTYTECYALGLDSEDVTDVPVVNVSVDKDGKFVVTLTHPDGKVITSADNVTVTPTFTIYGSPNAESGTEIADPTSVSPADIVGDGNVGYIRAQIKIDAK